MERKIFLEWQVGFSWTGYTKMNYFKPEEVEGLAPELVDKLNSARHVAGTPFIITSGKRSIESNERAMGVESSSHLKGLAVDLRVTGDDTRYLMVKGLLAAGFTRIGVYNLHIHVDIDTEKNAERLWVGVSH